MRYFKQFYIGVFATLFLCVNLNAQAYENYKTVGKALYTFMFWDVYDAELLTEDGAWSMDKPFALKLTYHKSLKGTSISQRSVVEIKKLGFNDDDTINSWHKFMEKTFPNVHKGDVITGVYNRNKQTVFYYNNEEVGRISDPEFGYWFFGIWLHKNTSEPKFRKRLLDL
ncbi:MAG: hypothetical protein CMF61_04980 [Magnetococcales bacterium]|nr:hypothetical protein [Magnetococcales bacterium]